MPFLRKYSDQRAFRKHCRPNQRWDPPELNLGLSTHRWPGTASQEEERTDRSDKPKGYTNEDIMRSIVMLRLAGSRVAEFAHRSMSLPSPTTARRNSVVSPLQVSVGKPTIREAEENIFSFLGPLADVESLDGSKIKHQVFVLDELAIEKRPRWDDRTNMFLGACREHSHKVPLEFVSEKELEIFCNALDKGEIHAACEVSYFFFVHIPSLSDPCSIFRQQLVLFARFLILILVGASSTSATRPPTM